MRALACVSSPAAQAAGDLAQQIVRGAVVGLAVVAEPPGDRADEGERGGRLRVCEGQLLGHQRAQREAHDMRRAVEQRGDVLGQFRQ